MQKAAQRSSICMTADFRKLMRRSGCCPESKLTAGAICSFAYGIPKPAVDGNVLRVVSRLLASDADIMKASVRAEMENRIEEVIPPDAAASDFNQGLIELGAIVCVPNGEPKCDVRVRSPISRRKRRASDAASG